MMTSSASH